MQNILINWMDYVSDSKCSGVVVIIGNYCWRRDGEFNAQWMKTFSEQMKTNLT